MATQQQVSILTIGLDFDWAAANLQEKIDTAAVRAAVMKGLKTLDGVEGLTHDLYLFVPDKEERVYVSEIEKKLRERAWDGIVVGWGVRAQPDMTEVFERTVNLIKEVSPRSKLLFTGPAPDHFAAVKRNFPHLQPGKTAE